MYIVGQATDGQLDLADRKQKSDPSVILKICHITIIIIVNMEPR